MNDDNEHIERQVVIKKLLRNLEFAEEGVQAAALDQAKLFFEAGRYKVQKLRQRNAAEARLELLKAKIGITILERPSDEKKTETYVKDLVARNKVYRQAVADYNRAVEEEVFAKALYDAFDMRMNAIKVIGHLSGMDAVLEKRMQERAEGLAATHRTLERKYGSS